MRMVFDHARRLKPGEGEIFDQVIQRGSALEGNAGDNAKGIYQAGD